MESSKNIKTNTETASPLDASDLMGALNTLKNLQYLPAQQRLQITLCLLQELLPKTTNEALSGIAAACIQELAKRANQSAVE